MKQEGAISGLDKLDAGPRALPLALCWAIWAGASAALWAIIIRLL